MISEKCCILLFSLFTGIVNSGFQRAPLPISKPSDILGMAAAIKVQSEIMPILKYAILICRQEISSAIITIRQDLIFLRD